MNNSIEVYGKEYRVKLENELLKYENLYLRKCLNDFHSSALKEQQKTSGYKDLISLMNLLRRKPIVYLGRKNSTFVNFEKRYYDSNGQEKFDEELNLRAESDLESLMKRLNAIPATKIFYVFKKYRTISKKYS